MEKSPLLVILLFVHFWTVFAKLSRQVWSIDASGSGDSLLLRKSVPLMVFGDSIFDAGNNNYINTHTGYQANFWPYGETFFRFPTGRATNGRTIPDFISEYANLPLVRPYLDPQNYNYDYGVNFASIGAGVLLESHQGLVIDLRTQLRYFNKVEKLLRHKLGREAAEAKLSSAVYLFSIGGNDYFSARQTNSSFLNSQASKEEYVGMVIGNLTSVIREIYNKGARKFGFLNLSPIGCIPSMMLSEATRSNGCDDELTQVGTLHNKVLSQALQKLGQSELEGFKYSIHDFFASISERTENPSRYGLKETKMACCGSGPYRGLRSCGRKGAGMEEYKLCENPSEFLFFDCIHTTEKVYEQLAELFWSGDSEITGPYNLKSLFEMDTELM